MNQIFSRTQILIQSVQRQVNTLIDRNDAYNMHIFQETDLNGKTPESLDEWDHMHVCVQRH